MLQLRYQKRLSAWLHSGQVGHCCCPSLSPAMCSYAVFERHELGYVSLAAIDRGSFLLGLACCSAFRPRTTSSTPFESSNDSQTGRALEGQRISDYYRSGESCKY